MERNKVVLVNEDDFALAEMDKMQAHRDGKLHRAFSVFIFNLKGEMLIHQRANHKYHGAGLWTNACCSHPQWNERVKESAKERLQFEMGMSCDLEHLFSFIYKATVENGLMEYEYDHVFVGYTNAEPVPNILEVQNYKWIAPEELLKQVAAQPQDFTYWFRVALEKVMDLFVGINR
ncbi:MAG: isopentenyl-diphosphate delta-isomerase [Niastella sp. SCN 39-18]|nr:isopentenyl-diphosphate Delta-isomerase [Sphingobacteriales bacterium]ODT53989.1 MAG: isopentenyl-diphosphate delta-isomerase [Niastella sp. SCN 39-18]OJW09854.1 MAG: isopentenyl-diphosphate delta-isomerase [Sphingobacteriales bacterium 39-19]